MTKTTDVDFIKKTTTLGSVQKLYYADEVSIRLKKKKKSFDLTWGNGEGFQGYLRKTILFTKTKRYGTLIWTIMSNVIGNPAYNFYQ